jgi:hypothetical protein
MIWCTYTSAQLIMTTIVLMSMIEQCITKQTRKLSCKSSRLLYQRSQVLLRESGEK